MVKVDDAARVEVLHHQQVRVVRPVLNLDLTLRCLLHSVHEHASEMFALG